METIKKIAERAVNVGSKWGIRVKQDDIENKLRRSLGVDLEQLSNTVEDREFMRIIIQNVVR